MCFKTFSINFSLPIGSCKWFPDPDLMTKIKQINQDPETQKLFYRKAAFPTPPLTSGVLSSRLRIYSGFFMAAASAKTDFYQHQEKTFRRRRTFEGGEEKEQLTAFTPEMNSFSSEPQRLIFFPLSYQEFLSVQDIQMAEKGFY